MWEFYLRYNWLTIADYCYYTPVKNATNCKLFPGLILKNRSMKWEVSSFKSILIKLTGIKVPYNGTLTLTNTVIKKLSKPVANYLKYL